MIVRNALWLLSSLPFAVYAQSASPPAGYTFGQQQLGNMVGGITAINANTVQNSGTYGSQNSNAVLNLQSSYATSNAGNTGLVSTGNAKLQECASYTPNPNNPNPALDSECSAVNLMASNPEQNAISQSGLTKNDSIFTSPTSQYNQGMSTSNPPSVAVGNGVTITPACPTVTTPGTTTTVQQSCTKTATPVGKQCVNTLSVQVNIENVCTVSGSAAAAIGTVNFSCNSATSASATYTIDPANQCHGGGCNSVYFPLSIPIVQGSPVSTSGYLARNYKGVNWEYTTLSYDGSSNSVTVTMDSAAPAPAPFTGLLTTAPVATSTWDNNCSTLQSEVPNTPAGGIPGISVNGVYTCPSGYDFSGVYCVQTNPNYISAVMVQGQLMCIENGLLSGKTLSNGICF